MSKRRIFKGDKPVARKVDRRTSEVRNYVKAVKVKQHKSISKKSVDASKMNKVKGF